MADEANETQHENRDNARVYELGFLIVPTVAEEEIGTEVSKIRDVIESNGGVIISDGWPKKRRLAYRMEVTRDHHTTAYDNAYFGWIKFEAEGEAAPAIEEKMRASTSVIRFLLIKTVREDTMAYRSVAAQSREREEEMDEEQVDEAIEELVGK